MGAADIDVLEVIGTLSSAEYVLTHEPPLPGFVAVLYQEQLRYIKGPHWSKWTNCTEEEYKRNKEEPFRHEWEYRARKLFVEITEDYK